MLKLTGIAIAAWVLCAILCAQPDTATYSFTLAPNNGQQYCNQISFTITAQLLTGTDSNCGPAGILSGAAELTTIYPETSASRVYIATETSYLSPYFWLFDVKHLKWAIYADNPGSSGTVLSIWGTLIPATPSKPASGVPAWAAGWPAAARNAMPETSQSYAFTFTGYCDGVTFTLANNIYTGTHNVVNCGLPDGSMAGAGGTVRIAPEKSPSTAYIVDDQLLESLSGPGFYVIDAQNMTWAVYLNQGTGTKLINHGTLTPGAPPVVPGLLPATFQKH